MEMGKRRKTKFGKIDSRFLKIPGNSLLILGEEIVASPPSSATSSFSGSPISISAFPSFRKREKPPIREGRISVRFVLNLVKVEKKHNFEIKYRNLIVSGFQ
jgi:hypothetical protein